MCKVFDFDAKDTFSVPSVWLHFRFKGYSYVWVKLRVLVSEVHVCVGMENLHPQIHVFLPHQLFCNCPKKSYPSIKLYY